MADREEELKRIIEEKKIKAEKEKNYKSKVKKPKMIKKGNKLQRDKSSE